MTPLAHRVMVTPRSYRIKEIGKNLFTSIIKFIINSSSGECNQNYILEAVRNLNERLEAIEKRVDDERMLVKTSDDVALMKKQKEENNHAIKLLESKIEILNKEIQKKGMEPNNSNKGNAKHTEMKE